MVGQCSVEKEEEEEEEESEVSECDDWYVGSPCHGSGPARPLGGPAPTPASIDATIWPH